MANDFYNHGGYPATNSSGSSANMRAELDLIAAGFDKLPALSGNALKTVRVNAAGTALEPFSNNFATVDGSETLTNKAVNLTSNTLTGTKAQFDAALSDDNFAYVGAANTFTQTQTISSGNLALTGTGQRITGDFSNATVANRALFQTSTTNGVTTVGVIPNGAADTAIIACYGASDPTNASVASILAQTSGGSGTVSFRSGVTGTGTYLPMTFYTGGAERMRIDTNGKLGVGVVPSGWASTWHSADVGSYAAVATNNASGAFFMGNLYHDGTNYRAKNNARSQLYICGTGGGGAHTFYSFDSVAAGAITTPRQLGYFNDNGDWLLSSGTGGLGYGTGAGGTVTQSTSRTTAVTLNKPTGAITMFNAAGSASWSRFALNNSLITANDMVVCQVNGAPSNNYQVFANGCTAGSCWINFVSISGTASDAPVINFAIIKGATS